MALTPIAYAAAFLRWCARADDGDRRMNGRGAPFNSSYGRGLTVAGDATPAGGFRRVGCRARARARHSEWRGGGRQRHSARVRQSQGTSPLAHHHASRRKRRRRRRSRSTCAGARPVAGVVAVAGAAVGSPQSAGSSSQPSPPPTGAAGAAPTACLRCAVAGCCSALRVAAHASQWAAVGPDGAATGMPATGAVHWVADAATAPRPLRTPRRSWLPAARRPLRR